METVVKTLLVMGLQASILAIVIMAFRKIFRNIPKIFTYVLWLVLLVRLVVPVMFESDYGITPSPKDILLSDTSKDNVVTDDNTDTTTDIVPNDDKSQSVVDNANPSMNNSDTSDQTQSGTAHITQNQAQNNSIGSNNATGDTSNDVSNAVQTGTSGASTTTSTTDNTVADIKFWQYSWFLPTVCVLWSIGTITVLLLTAIQYILMKRKLLFAIRVSDNIWECETVKSPFIMGFVKPKIYLPLSLPDDEREYILLHEQMHIKHLDHIIRLFMTLATAIHWWNPMVWLSMNLMKKDMEMLCDESATKAKASTYRKAYSMVLVKYAAKNSGLSPVLAFGESNTEGRVKHLMLLKKPKFYVTIATIVVLCFSLVNCGVKKTDNENTTNNNTENTAHSYIPEETVTLTVYSDTCSYEGIQEGWFADIIKEKFNVELNLLMASNEIAENHYGHDYDIIMAAGCDSDMYKASLEDGHFLDFNSLDMAQYMPYVTEHLSNSYVYGLDNNTEHIYGILTRTSLPGDYCGADIFHTWDMRYDYYEELGTPEISDINDWVNVLEQMKNAHPTNDAGKETYGVSYFNSWADVDETANSGMLYSIHTLVTGYYGYYASGIGFYDGKNDNYYGALHTEADGTYGPYIQMLKVNNELYKKGLIDPDSETQTYEEYQLKATNGQILSSVAGFMGNSINDNMYPVIPSEANSLAYEIGSSKWCISIDSETEYPELCMAIIDYLYTPEGMLTMQYGPKGECWDYDENGLTYLTELGFACINDRDTLINNVRFNDGCPMFNVVPYTYTATNPESGESYHFEYWENTVSEPANSVEASWREWTGASSIENYMCNVEPYYVAPNIEFSIDFSATELNQKYNDVSNIIVSKSWAAIKASTDEEFDAIIQDMITDATAAGYNELLEYSENHIRQQIKAAE